VEVPPVSVLSDPAKTVRETVYSDQVNAIAAEVSRSRRFRFWLLRQLWRYDGDLMRDLAGAWLDWSPADRLGPFLRDRLDRAYCLPLTEHPRAEEFVVMGFRSSDGTGWSTWSSDRDETVKALRECAMMIEMEPPPVAVAADELDTH
jgi:hypothetical protein